MTHLSANEFEITWALGITVTSSVLGTSFVVGLLGQSTVGVHSTEVEGTVQSATESAHIDVESELLVQGVEHLVLGVRLHEVDTRANVGTGLELEGKRAAGCGDTVGTAVVRTIKGTVLSTSGVGTTVAGVECVASVAVGGTGGSVEPSPVGIKRNGSSDGSAATRSRALLPVKLGVDLRGQCANLLGIHGSEEGRESGKGSRARHRRLVDEMMRMRN